MQHDLNISAVVMQCAWLGVGGPKPVVSIGFIRTIVYCFLDVFKQALGLQPVYIPLGANAGDTGILAAEGCLDGVKGLCYDPRCVSGGRSTSLPTLTCGIVC